MRQSLCTGILYLCSLFSMARADAQSVAPQTAVHSATGSLPAFLAVDHVTLNVPDPARSEAWYVSVLGFSVTSRNEQFRVLRRGDVTFILNKATDTAPRSDAATRVGVFHAALGVAPAQFQTSVAALRDRHVVVDVSADADQQRAYFQDPDGIQLELTANAPDFPTQPKAAVNWLADVLLDHLEETSVDARAQRHLPLDRVPDLSAAAAQREAAFNQQMRDRLEKIPSAPLAREEELLRGILRYCFTAGATAEQDYWFRFAVTPYSGGMPIEMLHQGIAAMPLDSSASRAAFIDILHRYAVMLRQARSKSLEQAARGIRIPRPALPGVRRTLEGLRAAAVTVFETTAGASPSGDATHAAFIAEVQSLTRAEIVPAYDALLSVFDDRYEKAAPAGVGLALYRDGKDYYRRRIFAETGLNLAPQTIHAQGLAQVADLDARLAQIRAEVGFRGNRDAFHAMLRADPRFLATTPAEVEARYRDHIAKIAPLLPKYFQVIPKAPYTVERLAAASEAGMTYGYYNPPSAINSRGIYYYNGSNLKSRSLVTSAHLMYHELLPGHHLRLALALEKTTQHPLLSVLTFGAFDEGWAEYAAQLAVEMGGYRDPYDLYGHYLSQAFLAARLVVDTGMNYLGWSRERAEQFMRDHTFESEAQIATETLRYSTDMPAQALDYRLGYMHFIEGRRRAESSLGAGFDLRAFNTMLSNSGAMPLDVLDREIERFIEDARAASPTR